MSSPSAESRPETPARDFIREIVAQDLGSGKHRSGAIVTRFPPEPNGRLHIGHAKAICIDFGVAQEFGGRCNLRFDDTNPVKESQEYVDENLDLFRRMRGGEFADGEHVLRAKIDMASGNINMRDPVMYRIRKTPHQRTGDAWVIYPMYDWAHGQSDHIEGVTYSLCSLEYEDHRPLYDWYLDALGLRPPRPRQIEFARLNLNYTVMSKRMLLELVEGGHVGGWDDPRMPTLSGLRRRGYTPESIRNFCERIGVAKRENLIDIGLLEFCVREHLNKVSLRRMVVFDPLKITITNFSEGNTEILEGEDNPEDHNAG